MFPRAHLIGCLLLLFSLCWTTASDAGLGFRVNVSALKFVGDFVANHFLCDHIRQSVDGTNETKSYQFGDCSTQNFQVRDCVAPVSNVTVLSGIRIFWTLNAAQISVGFGFELNNGIDSVSGEGVFQLSEVSVAAELTLRRDSSGRLDIALTKCSVDMAEIYSDVTFTPRAAVNSERFEGFEERDARAYLSLNVRDRVNTEFCDVVRNVSRLIPDLLNRTNSELESHAGFIFNDTLVTEPTVENDTIELLFNGRFQKIGDVDDYSIETLNLTLPPSESSSMISVFMYEQVVRSLCNVLFETGWLRLNITRETLGILLTDFKYGYSYLLDTTSADPFAFGNIFPYLSEKYPNTSVKLVITAASPPSVAFHTGFLSQGYLSVLQGEFNLDIVVPDANGFEEMIAKLNVSARIDVTAIVLTGRVTVLVDVPEIAIKDNGSPDEFAPHLPRFNSLLQKFVNLVLVPWIDVYGALGLPLHFRNGFQLINSHLNLVNGEFSLSRVAACFRANIVYDSTLSGIDYDNIFYRYLLSLQGLWG